MITRLLTLICLASCCAISTAFAAPALGVSGLQMHVASASENPIKPAVLELPLPNQSRRPSSHSEREVAPASTPAAVQWIFGAVPPRCQARGVAASSSHLGNCLVI